ncbi:MAG: hypothetical protein KGP28_06730 [Bdellovibrionales bacterium]|nr:hypothetical protein [Bdellovibrionales bacterium]
MSKKKGKFDLTRIVHEGFLKDGETIFFVSNPTLTAKVQKQPNGEFKIVTPDGTTTVHAFAVKCLGAEPPEHASRWFRNEKGATLYQLWHMAEGEEMAA